MAPGLQRLELAAEQQAFLKVHTLCLCEERSDEAIPKYGGRLLRPAKNAGLATTQNKEARL
jgi:hypothetical protein